MSRYLFLLWEGGGNVPPQLGIVSRLVARGHDVRVLTEPSLERDVTATGASFVSLNRAPHRSDRSPDSDFVRDWEARTPMGEFARARDRVLIGPAARYAQDVLAELDRAPADVLVVDWLLFGGALAGEAAGIPTALICHNPWMVPEPGRPAPGLGLKPMSGLAGRVRDSLGNRMFTASFDRALPALNAARRQLGLAELDTVRRLFDQVDRVLVLTDAEFDFLPTSRAANVVHVGPVLDQPVDVQPWSTPWPADDPRPLVLVTTSSYFQDPRRMLETACAAIRRVGARAVVTTGAIDPATLPPGEDIFAARSLNHDQIVPSVQAVISHCGLGTVHRALILGVPVLCQPLGRDQPDVAARVVAAGAGLRVGAKASPRRVAHALQRLLTTPSYAAQAQATGTRLAASAQTQRYVSELETLVTSRTLHRPLTDHIRPVVPTGTPNGRRSDVGSDRQDR